MKTSLSAKLTAQVNFLKRINFGLGSFIVSTYGQADNLPKLKPNQDYSFTPMDMTSDKDKQIWLHVLNDAFERDYKVSDFNKKILKHPIINAIDTIFLSNAQGEVIGATSLGVFHKNPNIGVSHYIAIRKKYQGQKLGYFMVLSQYHWLAKKGIQKFESETTIERKKPIFLHFTLGFQPKSKLDNWNTQNLSTKLFQSYINNKLDAYYQDWQLRTNSST